MHKTDAICLTEAAHLGSNLLCQEFWYVGSDTVIVPHALTGTCLVALCRNDSTDCASAVREQDGIGKELSCHALVYCANRLSTCCVHTVLMSIQGEHKIQSSEGPLNLQLAKVRPVKNEH